MRKMNDFSNALRLNANAYGEREASIKGSEKVFVLKDPPSFGRIGGGRHRKTFVISPKKKYGGGVFHVEYQKEGQQFDVVAASIQVVPQKTNRRLDGRYPPTAPFLISHT